MDVDLLCSDVSITKAPKTGDEVLDLGETATFVVTVNTATGGDAPDVVVSDTLPLKPGLIWSTRTPDCVVTPQRMGLRRSSPVRSLKSHDGGLPKPSKSPPTR